MATDVKQEIKATANEEQTNTAPKKAPTKKNVITAANKYKVSVALLNIREKASLTSSILGTLDEGEIIEISSRTPQGFGKLADREGYIKLEFVEKDE